MSIEPVLTVADLSGIFRVAKPTIHRWVAASRRGKNNFPQPINQGKKLFWSKAVIEDFINETPQVNVSQTESTAKQRKRHNAALDELENKHRITVKLRTGKRQPSDLSNE